MTVGDPREHRTAPHHRTAHLCTAGCGSRGPVRSCGAAPREHTLVARVLVDPPACRVIVVTLLDETRDSRGTPLTRRRLASRVSLYNVISIVILPTTCDALEGKSKRGTPPAVVQKATRTLIYLQRNGFPREIFPFALKSRSPSSSTPKLCTSRWLRYGIE